AGPARGDTPPGGRHRARPPGGAPPAPARYPPLRPLTCARPRPRRPRPRRRRARRRRHRAAPPPSASRQAPPDGSAAAAEVPRRALGGNAETGGVAVGSLPAAPLGFRAGHTSTVLLAVHHGDTRAF